MKHVKRSTSVDASGMERAVGPQIVKVQTMIKRVDHLTDSEVPCYESMDTAKNILELSKEYQIQFSRLARSFEKWGEQRRKLLRKMDKTIQNLETTRSYTALGTLICSTVDAVGTVAALVLDSFHSDWASKILFTSAAIGCLSIVCNIVDATETKSKMEDIRQTLEADKDTLKDVQSWIQRPNNFDYKVHKHLDEKVDVEVMRKIQTEFELSKSQRHKTISKAIFLSLAAEKPDVLNDKAFISKVNMFARDSVAEKWWIRMKYRHQQLFPGKLLPRISGVHKDSLLCFSVPLSHYRDAPACASILLNCLQAAEAFGAYQNGGYKPEIEALQLLKQDLQKEYRMAHQIFEQLAPYSY